MLEQYLTHKNELFREIAKYLLKKKRDYIVIPIRDKGIYITVNKHVFYLHSPGSSTARRPPLKKGWYVVCPHDGGAPSWNTLPGIFLGEMPPEEVILTIEEYVNSSI